MGRSEGARPVAFAVRGVERFPAAMEPMSKGRCDAVRQSVQHGGRSATKLIASRETTELQISIGRNHQSSPALNLKHSRAPMPRGSSRTVALAAS